MLNINQNFDLKAPVFNFDRDYFNSVEELNAYDTSNVPDHFVTNVAGMLYLFTGGRWLPIIGIALHDPDDPDVHAYNVNLLNDHCHVSVYPDDDNYIFYLEAESSNARMDSDGSIDLYTNYSSPVYPYIDMIQEYNEIYKELRLGIQESKDFGLFIQNGEDVSIHLTTDKKLEDWEEYEGYSPVDMRLVDGNNNIDVNPRIGFTHKTENGLISCLDGLKLIIRDNLLRAQVSTNIIGLDRNRKNAIELYAAARENIIYIGDNKFKLSRPIDNTEGGVISGIKSLTAFANPSATKVWATDGSTVDLTTKANASDLATKANKSDVLLKKNSRNGYYIGDSNDSVGNNAFSIGGNTADGSNSFASGYDTKAYGNYSHVEGLYTEAIGESAHAEGDFTYANGDGSHSEGRYTRAKGFCSHAEGYYTYADGFAAHALGTSNVSNKNAIHSVGIGDSTTNKNAEYIYAKNNKNGNDLADDPKNGYKYLIGVGGYDGISTDNTTYKSVQEVIADLTARIEQLETKVRALEAANTPA